MKNLVVDLDGTLTTLDSNNYAEVSPNQDVLNRLKEYKDNGFEITISTARNMRTFNGDFGKITKHTLPIIFEWLEKHDVPFDRVLIGKPWCGTEGFYIDDKAIRPSEFIKYNYSEIVELLARENKCS